eukprot:3623398-Pleurochrysis_carterae.AAC.2
MAQKGRVKTGVHCVMTESILSDSERAPCARGSVSGACGHGYTRIVWHDIGKPGVSVKRDYSMLRNTKNEQKEERLGQEERRVDELDSECMPGGCRSAGSRREEDGYMTSHEWRNRISCNLVRREEIACKSGPAGGVKTLMVDSPVNPTLAAAPLAERKSV